MPRWLRSCGQRSPAVRRLQLALALCWTLLVCACGSTGLGLFSVHMRRAVHTATEVAAQLFAHQGGLVHYNTVAGHVITAVVVVCAPAVLFLTHKN
jgi:hypothetical protein